jgi:hypothetical protein
MFVGLNENVIQVMKQLIPLLIVATFLSSCSKNLSEDKIIGQWKIDSCTYINPNDTFAGLRKDYYNMNKNRVIEYKKDKSAKWKEGTKSFSYKIDSKDSLIICDKKTIKILQLDNTQLIIKETVKKSGTLITYFKKINS